LFKYKHDLSKTAKLKDALRDYDYTTPLCSPLQGEIWMKGAFPNWLWEKRIFFIHSSDDSNFPKPQVNINPSHRMSKQHTNTINQLAFEINYTLLQTGGSYGVGFTRLMPFIY